MPELHGGPPTAYLVDSSTDCTANVYRGYREFTGIFCTLYRVFPFTGKNFDVSRKFLSIWQGIPVKVRFIVDLTGNPCSIYSYITGDK